MFSCRDTIRNVASILDCICENPPFIVTLSGMLLFRGIALIILDGLTISLTHKSI